MSEGAIFPFPKKSPQLIHSSLYLLLGLLGILSGLSPDLQYLSQSCKDLNLNLWTNSLASSKGRKILY